MTYASDGPAMGAAACLARVARSADRLLAAAHLPGYNLLPIRGKTEFKAKVLGADLPVLVLFHKTLCPTCVWMEPGLDRLADEYRGRAVIARYKHINPLFIHTSWSITKKYKVYLVPTVILFVAGQERGRWFMEYDMDIYRQALDAALAETTTGPLDRAIRLGGNAEPPPADQPDASAGATQPDSGG